MNQDKQKLLARIVAYGALWGLAEATLGYALHWIDPFLPGVVMFPIGAAILVRAYGQTQSRLALPLVGAVAAAIKAFDFLLPTIAPLRVVNPMICIVLEALVLALVAPALETSGSAGRIVLLPAASVLWRVFFLVSLFVEWPLLGTPSGQIASLSAMTSFALVAGLQSGGIAIATDFAVRRIPAGLAKPFAKPAFAALLTGLAIVATILL